MTGDDEIRDQLVEMAWARTRAAVGLGYDEGPYSLHEPTVGVELWGEQLRQLRRLRRVLDAEVTSTRRAVQRHLVEGLRRRGER
jgi:hypothetical protein